MWQQRQQCAHDWLSLHDCSKAVFKCKTTERQGVCVQNKHFAFYLKYAASTPCVTKKILTSMPGWQPSIPLSVAPTRNNFKSGKTQRTHFHVSGITQHATTQYTQHCNNHAPGELEGLVTQKKVCWDDTVLLGNQLPTFKRHYDPLRCQELII